MDLASLVVFELSACLFYSGDPIYELIAVTEPPVGILSNIKDEVPGLFNKFSLKKFSFVFNPQSSISLSPSDPLQLSNFS